MSAHVPLAARLRPQRIEDIVGQDHLLQPGSPLRRLVGGESSSSMVMWGPAGTGKTTLARLAAGAGRRLVELSALDTGVREVRAVISQARQEAAALETVVFLDEIHRFSKNQQDSLLAAVEEGVIILLAATTENPSFAVIPPLRSRCTTIALRPLTPGAICQLLRQALRHPEGLPEVTAPQEVLELIARLAEGDARWALNALEAAALRAGSARGDGALALEDIDQVVSGPAVHYDARGDAHYDVTSAFVKSIRGSDPDAALHYLARMLQAGEDPRYIARRLVVHASEDVGLADPSALLAALGAAQAVQLIGMPEARLALAQATVHLACAPKSNALLRGITSALQDVEAGRSGEVPAHLRDAHYPGARALGHGQGYTYPHDEPQGVSAQEYLPPGLSERQYYHPSRFGHERALQERLERLRSLRRGEQLE